MNGLAVIAFVVASLVLGLGMAPVVTLATDVIIGTVPPERAGVASGISETGAELGGALARDTLGGAAEAAESVPGASGAALLDAARDAFTDGMQVAALSALTVTIAAAVFTVIALRRFATTPGPG